MSWLVANFMLYSVMWYGGMVLAFTGLLMLGANLAFTSINSHGRSLMIHFGYEESAVLTPEYGWSFWLCLSVGRSRCLNRVMAFILFPWPNLQNLGFFIFCLSCILYNGNYLWFWVYFS